MPTTFDFVTSTTLSSATTSITLNLPSGYTDFEIRIRARSAKTSVVYDGLAMWFNGDTNSANYTREEIYTEQAGTGAEKAASTLLIGNMPAQSENAAYFSYSRVYLPNALNSSYKKIAFTETGMTASTGNYSTWFNTMYWNNTNALTSVSFSTTPASGNNLVANTVISVFGILKA